MHCSNLCLRNFSTRNAFLPSEIHIQSTLPHGLTAISISGSSSLHSQNFNSNPTAFSLSLSRERNRQSILIHLHQTSQPRASAPAFHPGGSGFKPLLRDRLSWKHSTFSSVRPANTGLVLKARPWPLPSLSLKNHYSLTTRTPDAKQSTVPTASINKPHINKGRTPVSQGQTTKASFVTRGGCVVCGKTHTD